MTRNKIDFKKHPYRGILTKVAKARGTYVHHVRRGWLDGRAEIVADVLKEIEQRKKIIDRAEQVVATIVKEQEAQEAKAS